MKNLIKKFNDNKNKLKSKLTIFTETIASTIILTHSRVLAASNTESIDGFITFACDWLTKIRRSYSTSWRSNVCLADGNVRMQKVNHVD